MAKILTDDRPVYARRAERTMSSNRAEQELKIGVEAKEFLDSFFTTLNDAPSEIGTYYQTHVGETTFSNTLNLQKKVSDATKFNKILDFVTWGPKSDKDLDKKDEEEREAGYNPTELERIILQGTVRPVVGDHLTIRSQGLQSILYQITNVEIQKMIDKPIYAITMVQSPTFSTVTIENNVVATYRFIFGNIGSGRKTILLDTVCNKIEKISKTMKDLNEMYVKTFYDETYDILRYRGTGLSTTFISCKALREFQNEYNILRYGEDMNTLFVDYPFITNDDLKDYKMSYINKILRRKIKKIEDTPSILNVDNPLDRSCIMELDYKRREDYNIENVELLFNDIIEEYETPNDYTTKFYHNTQTEFSLLTNFRKSDITLMELNSRSTDISTRDYECYIVYKPTSKIFLYILDAFLSRDYNKIINTDILDDYTPSNNNIDDYLMLPLVMFSISEAIDTIERDDLVVSF